MSDCEQKIVLCLIAHNLQWTLSGKNRQPKAKLWMLEVT